MAKVQQKYRLNIEWMPTDEDYLFVEVHRAEISRQRLDQEIKKFRAYWMNRKDAKGEKSERYWKAAFRNWIMNVIVKPAYQPFETAKDQSRRIALEQLTGGRQDASHIIDI
jgi:hypothetical protein